MKAQKILYIVCMMNLLSNGMAHISENDSLKRRKFISMTHFMAPPKDCKVFKIFPTYYTDLRFEYAFSRKKKNIVLSAGIHYMYMPVDFVNLYKIDSIVKYPNGDEISFTPSYPVYQKTYKEHKEALGSDLKLFQYVGLNFQYGIMQCWKRFFIGLRSRLLLNYLTNKDANSLIYTRTYRYFIYHANSITGSYVFRALEKGILTNQFFFQTFTEFDAGIKWNKILISFTFNVNLLDIPNEFMLRRKNSGLYVITDSFNRSYVIAFLPERIFRIMPGITIKRNI